MRTPFRMNDEALQAFGELKERFTRASMLRHFDPTLRIRVETDASGFAAAGYCPNYLGLTQSQNGTLLPSIPTSLRLQNRDTKPMMGSYSQ